jgi:4'-phosphopantetheinyl transferase EntD
MNQHDIFATVEFKFCAGLAPDVDSASWLTTEELEVYGNRPEASRASWLLGRIVAKRLLMDRLPTDVRPKDVAVFSRDGLGRGMRPQVFVHGTPYPCSLSISHAGGAALAAITAREGLRIGVDLVPTFAPSPGFLSVAFSPSEAENVRWNRASPEGIWATKEAAYKAVSRTESFCPQDIEVSPREPGLMAFEARNEGKGRSGMARLISVGSLVGALAALDCGGGLA